MEQQPVQPSPKKSPLALLFDVIVVLLLVTVAWQAYRMQNLDDMLRLADSNLTAYQLQQERQQSNSEVDWSTVVESGLGNFQVRLPSGWGPIVNDTDGDYLELAGNLQPTLFGHDKVTVQKTKGHGKDGRSIFSMVLLAKGEAAPPQGTAETFNVGKGEDEIKGTKYTYVYPEDSIEGIGSLRLAGDRNYEYVLPTPDGKELHIYYSVYGSDPRNLIETVDEIVRTVTLPKTSQTSL